MKFQAERLLMVAKKLESLPRGKFNYAHWAGDDWRGAPDLSCGTTVCALGWATTIPALRREGLRLLKDEYGFAYVGLKKGRQVVVDHSIQAACRTFGISKKEAMYLFYPANVRPYRGLAFYSPSRDADAGEVAAHIRKFVELKLWRDAAIRLWFRRGVAS